MYYGTIRVLRSGIIFFMQHSSFYLVYPVCLLCLIFSVPLLFTVQYSLFTVQCPVSDVLSLLCSMFHVLQSTLYVLSSTFCVLPSTFCVVYSMFEVIETALLRPLNLWREICGQYYRCLDLARNPHGKHVRRANCVLSYHIPNLIKSEPKSIRVTSNVLL